MSGSAIFCSVIIPTVGRSTLARAVASVLNQDFAAGEFEVVVVNDSGASLVDESWQQSPRVRVIDTQRRRQVLARNAGAATAAGRYLLFLDDDDWLMPGALHYYWSMAQQHPEAGCLFGSFELVDEHGSAMSRHSLPTSGNVAVQLASGCWMQLASVLTRTDVFFGVGGLPALFRISEEIDLFNRIAMREDFAGTNTLVAQIYRGANWQTSVDYTDVNEYNRWSRDRLLSMPRAFARLCHSADNSSYWHGRVVRLYVVSMLWNWRRKHRFYTGASRGIFALRSLLSARKHLLSQDFWRAVRADFRYP